MNLFQHSRQKQIEQESPLANRMRPRVLDEYVGQEHILGHGRLLRRAIQADQLASLIFYGPPGTGKTTLAMVIANSTKSHFITINAVLAGVKEIREAIAEADERRTLHNQRTTLFVDEVHRWNKAQQDALLPHVERGTILLIGATTANPYFEVNSALVSRSRIFQLQPLTSADLHQIAAQALADEERGYGNWRVEVAEDALAHLVNIANGDARTLLNALELAVETTPADEDGVVRVSLGVAEESIQRRAVLYDKDGDSHYDTISAFIKSLRGSDPDAALYWLAKMVYAGEDPRFLFRRMAILASEDIGMADPNAAGVVNNCWQIYEKIGLPEGYYPLANCAIYLATAAKSNSVMAFFDALNVVQAEQEADVPNHLKDGTRDKEGFGHGKGYLYPHAYRDHWVAQQYLPTALQGRLFYQPSDQGYEQKIQEEVARRREAQLAAMLEGELSAVPEVFTTSPVDKQREAWLQRAINASGKGLAEVREKLFALAEVQRHHRLLDVAGGSGLLVWEGVRRAPEGWGVDGRGRAIIGRHFAPTGGPTARCAFTAAHFDGRAGRVARPVAARGAF
jgi:putative ATPase